MDATTLAAWVGASGTVANAAALLVVERRKAKPDLALSTRYYPPSEEQERYGSPSDTVEITVASAHPVTIVAAGLAPARRLLRWRRTRLTTFVLRPGGSPLPSRGLPVAVAGGERIVMHLPVEKAVGRRQVDRSRSHVGWIEASGKRIYSPEAVEPHGRRQEST